VSAVGTPERLLLLPVIALGLVVGSFLNVVIVRLPEGRSIVRPGSACPACGAAIAWYDNIPIVSFLALRGRCRVCEAPISIQYPIVEAATAALFALAWTTFGPSGQLPVAMTLLAALVAITGIDLAHQVIPDVITLPGIVVGVLANAVTRRVPWSDALLGVVICGGIFFVIILASGGGMGGGDMKLAAMLGAFLGWRAGLFSLLVAVVLGGVIAVVLLVSGRKGRKDPIPFAPCLAVGGAAGLFWGSRVLAPGGAFWWLAAFRS
jgi:leader peptidase (prepilin peptidase) / N-methyltransferase